MNKKSLSQRTSAFGVWGPLKYTYQQLHFSMTTIKDEAQGAKGEPGSSTSPRPRCDGQLSGGHDVLAES